MRQRIQSEEAMTAPFRIVRRDQGLKKVGQADSENLKFYLERLMKMIPGEVVGLYLIGSGFIPKDQALGLVIWSVVCLLGVIVVKAYGTMDPEKNLSPDWTHVAISAVAFAIWLYSLGGPFASFGLAVPYIGSLLVLAWSFFVPIFYKGI